MTSRDLDEAVSRLRAASLRNEPSLGDLASHLGPPLGQPEIAGQGAGHAYPVGPATRMPAQAAPVELPRSQWTGPMSGDAFVAPPRREPQTDAPSVSIEPRHAQAAEPAYEDYDPRMEEVAPAPRPSPLAWMRDRLPQRGAPADGADGTEPGLGARLVERAQAWRAQRAERRAAALAAAPVETASAGTAPARKAPLTERERRWIRRRRRYVMEEILGWILVPIILVALYFGLTWGLALFGYTIDDVVAGVQTVIRTIQGGG